MPVIKLTQESIGRLRCSDDKRCEQFCDSNLPGLLLECRKTDPDRPTWYVRYKDRAGKTRYARLGHYPDISLDEARKRAKKLKAELTLGADPHAEREAKRAVPTFGEVFVEKYMPEAKVHNRGWKKKQQMYDLRIKSVFGHKRITEIKRADIRAWHVVLREDGLSPAYSDRFLALVRHVFNFCVQTELLDKNPAVGVKPFNPDNRIEDYLNQDDLKRFLTMLNTCKNRSVAQILLFAISTGMRIGEILKLKWADIDLERKLLHIPAANSKSKRIRSIPLNETALNVLSETGTRSHFDSVFINRKTRKPYTTISKQWDKLRKESGFSHLRIHSLRHQFASLLINQGVSLNTVKELLGHAQIATTERYSHLTIDSMAGASDRVSVVLNGAMPKSPAELEPAAVGGEG